MSDQENLPSAAADAETKQRGRPFQPGEGIESAHKRQPACKYTPKTLEIWHIRAW
jgi:hypothetical protein